MLLIYDVITRHSVTLIPRRQHRKLHRGAEVQSSLATATGVKWPRPASNYRPAASCL